MKGLSALGKQRFGQFLAYSLGCGTLYYGLNQFQAQQSLQSKRNVVNDVLKKFQPVEIKGNDNVVYPWYAGDADQWEYQLVKLRGYLKDERFFVRRERNGKAGYLVFGAFVTSKQSTAHKQTIMANPEKENGLCVCLGWVPLEHQSEVTMESPLEVIEAGENTINMADPFTSLQVQSESNPVEEDGMPLSDFVGVLRRGEKQDILNGRRNWPFQGNFNFVDLKYMSRFFRLFNTDAAAQFYVERIVSDLDDDAETLYPIPATKETFTI